MYIYIYVNCNIFSGCKHQYATNTNTSTVCLCVHGLNQLVPFCGHNLIFDTDESYTSRPSRLLLSWTVVDLSCGSYMVILPAGKSPTSWSLKHGFIRDGLNEGWTPRSGHVHQGPMDHHGRPWTTMGGPPWTTLPQAAISLGIVTSITNHCYQPISTMITTPWSPRDHDHPTARNFPPQFTTLRVEITDQFLVLNFAMIYQ